MKVSKSVADILDGNQNPKMSEQGSEHSNAVDVAVQEAKR